MATFNMSRSASFYESGIGRGLGFRDSNQDLLGFVHMVPARARERILDLAATQLQTGGALSPIPAAHQARQQRHRRRLQRRSALADPRRRRLSQGNRRLEHSRRAGAVRQRARLRAAALRASAAQLQLHARTPRPARPAADRPRRLERLPEPELLLRHAGPVLPDHHQQGRQGRRVGLHRRPVRAGGARNWRPSPATADSNEEAERYLAEAAKMEKVICQHGWDGEWFLRAYDDFGTHDRLEGVRGGQDLHRVQGLLRLAGIGLEDGKAPNWRSNRSTSIWPPSTASCCSSRRITKYYLDLGEISSYPPGYKENAGIFCHNNPWVIIAETMARQRRPRASITTRASIPRRARRSATCTAASRMSMRR